jgi:hypothetical protein
MLAIIHMWILDTWNVVSLIQEHNFTFNLNLNKVTIYS